MKDNFDRCLAHVLTSEGGYVNDPNDPAGAYFMSALVASISVSPNIRYLRCSAL